MNFLRVSFLKSGRMAVRRFNFRKVGRNEHMDKGEGFDQYAAHSPLFMGRWGPEEQRSKIFFEHPPVPNRIAKFAMLAIFVLTVSGGVRNKMRRKYKKQMMRRILPFSQAMEVVRYTALEQRNYMIIKSLADSIHPGMFSNIRWRYHQEDIYVPEVRSNAKKFWGGSIAYNQSMIGSSKFAPSTFLDKGLFDTREIGYTY